MPASRPAQVTLTRSARLLKRRKTSGAEAAVGLSARVVPPRVVTAGRALGASAGRHLQGLGAAKGGPEVGGSGGRRTVAVAPNLRVAVVVAVQPRHGHRHGHAPVAAPGHPLLVGRGWPCAAPTQREPWRTGLQTVGLSNSYFCRTRSHRLKTEQFRTVHCTAKHKMACHQYSPNVR